MDAKDLVKQVKADEVKFISLQFTDVTGTVKSVDMPLSG
jgi:glutamine synthetase